MVVTATSAAKLEISYIVCGVTARCIDIGYFQQRIALLVGVLELLGVIATREGRECGVQLSSYQETRARL